MLGRCLAIDFLGDGSFYLLDTPGHAIGHMCGLCRTTASDYGEGNEATFLVLGGDCAHHGGEFRPTRWLRLLDEVEVDGFKGREGGICPRELLESVHRLSCEGKGEGRTEPFLLIGETGANEVELARESVGKVEEFGRSLYFLLHESSVGLYHVMENLLV